MPAAAIAARPSSTLAIVATLGSAALLSFLLRLCGRGGRLRSRGTEEWVLCVGAVCVIADVVATGLKVRREWGTVGANGVILVWVETMVQILGLGFVKISVACAVLSRAVRNWHRHVVLGYICIITLLTVFWFGSTLLFSGPITIDWSLTADPILIVHLLDFINSTLDVASSVLIAALPLPLLWTTHFQISLCTQFTLAAIYTTITTAIVFASLRTYLFYSTWQTTTTATSSHSSSPSPSTTLCTSIALTLALLSASLLPLPKLLSSFQPRRLSKRTLASTSPSTPRTYPTNSFASTDTVIRHPAPSLLTLRFHDAESNLDFDMASTAATSRAQTMRSHPSHPPPPPCPLAQGSSHDDHHQSRRVSDWSQFSGFTFYTTPDPSARQSARHSLLLAVPPPTPRVSASGLPSVGDTELRTRRLRAEGCAKTTAGRDSTLEWGVGVAVSTLGGRRVGSDSVQGEEMQELARVFADRERAWGGEGTVQGTAGT